VDRNLRLQPGYRFAGVDHRRFTGNNAPTSLDGTVVTVADSLRMSSTSARPGERAGAFHGSNRHAADRGHFGIECQPAADHRHQRHRAGLYAPSQLLIGGNQYAGALFSTTSSETWVLPPGAVTGLTSQRAKPGDLITLYGIGFGGNLPTGQIAQGIGNTLPIGSFQISFDGTPATVNYAA